MHSYLSLRCSVGILPVKGLQFGLNIQHAFTNKIPFTSMFCFSHLSTNLRAGLYGKNKPLKTFVKSFCCCSGSSASCRIEHKICTDR